MKTKQAENPYLSKFKEWLIIQGKSSQNLGTFVYTAARFLKWSDQQGIEPENTGYNDILAYIQYQKNKGCKQKTQQLTVIMLKHFFNFLISEEAMEENPAGIILIRGVKSKILYDTLTPQELESLYQRFNAEKSSNENGEAAPPQYKNELERKRNKILLGLLIYQGLKAGELARMELQDLRLREGKIVIAGSRKSEERTMKLEAHQVYDLLDYINTTRKEILQLWEVKAPDGNPAPAAGQTSKVFTNTCRPQNFNRIMQQLAKSLREINPKIKDVKHIRASVITNWLKVYNLRKVQYMAGHRYVSSTESYQQNNIEELQDDIRKYHPIG